MPTPEQAGHSYNSISQYKSLEDNNLQQIDEILHSKVSEHFTFYTSLETAAMFGIIKNRSHLNPYYKALTFANDSVR